MNTFHSEIMQFAEPPKESVLSLAEAAQMIRNREACAILLDVFSEEEANEFWNDRNFPDVTPHKVFKGAGKSGLSIGPTQRLTGIDLINGLIDYFSYAGQWNQQLKKSQLVQYFAKELNAGYLKVGEWGEFPIASKRSYSAESGSAASVPPHCDCISFGRDELWPFKKDYVSDSDQLSFFLSVKEDDTDSALVLWNYRVSGRPELDELMSEYSETGTIAQLNDVENVRVSARPGQVSILNTQYMHEVEQCKSTRNTMGSFMVWKDEQWKLFH